MDEGWFLSLASGINDNGWIVGNAINRFTGDQHAFLLTPIPEPGILTLLFTGMGLLVVISRRRNLKSCLPGQAEQANAV